MTQIASINSTRKAKIMNETTIFISGKARTAIGVAVMSLFGVSLSAMAAQPTAGKSYSYSSLGNPAATVSARPVSCASVCSPSIALVGGGYDVGEAFRWMIAQAGVKPASGTKPGTGGRFVIIRATGTDAYNPYLYSTLGQIDPTSPKNYEMVGGKDLGLTSVETLIIPSRAAAQDEFVLRTLNNASAIFIAGGDQSDYYNYWQDTLLTDALKLAVSNGIPVGGTSAGTAMLGQYAFDALNGDITSAQALNDPFNKGVTIDPLNTSSKTFVQKGSFMDIGSLSKVITDTHFNTRDRIGRLFSFVSRIETGCANGVENVGSVNGIGIDEETALLISGSPGNVKAEMVVNPYNSENTTAQYTSQNSAYFVKSMASPSTCAAKKPLVSNSGIQVFRMTAQPSMPSPSSTATQYSFKVQAAVNLSNLGSLQGQSFSDGSSIAGPFSYGASNGAVLGASPY
jgi:cyanophycinase